MESVDIDWYDELKENPDKWINHGRNVLEDSCTCKTQDKDSSKVNRETNVRYSGHCEKCEISEDECQPMMNYGYPLNYLPDESNILKIVKETCLTVMENQDTGAVFLVLCGGGMNLSQSVAYAFLLSGERIPDGLALEVCLQPCLSIGKKEYLEVMKSVKEELKHIQFNAKSRLKRLNETVKEFKQKEATKMKIIDSIYLMSFIDEPNYKEIKENLERLQNE